MDKQFFGKIHPNLKLNNIIVYFWMSFCIMISACSSNYLDEILIEKRKKNSGPSSFPSYDFLIQRLYFQNDKQIYNVNYALNGWQIIDSSVINYRNNNVCEIEFKPKYNEITRKLEVYEYSDSFCYGSIDDFYELNNINDKYRLSKNYVNDLVVLIENQPVLSQKGYLFQGGIFILLFIEYGIPKEELLMSFDFKIDNHLLQYDNFYFENYFLTRKYEYDENKMLKSVTIHVDNKIDSSKRVFIESFYIR